MTFHGRRLTGVLLAAALATGVPVMTAPAFAQQQGEQAPAEVTPEQLALARAVIDFTGAGASFDNVVPQLLLEARSVVLRTRPGVQSDLDTVIIELDKEFQPKRDELLNEIARIYAENFTEDELKEITAFYRSPTGRKLTETTPQILERSYGRLQVWTRELGAQVMDRLREEMKKRGHDI